MDKELESITQVTTVGDLRSKLVEAEEAKVEVEAVLLERVSTSTYFLFSRKAFFCLCSRHSYFLNAYLSHINMINVLFSLLPQHYHSTSMSNN